MFSAVVWNMKHFVPFMLEDIGQGLLDIFLFFFKLK